MNPRLLTKNTAESKGYIRYIIDGCISIPLCLNAFYSFAKKTVKDWNWCNGTLRKRVQEQCELHMSFESKEQCTINSNSPRNGILCTALMLLERRYEMQLYTDIWQGRELSDTYPIQSNALKELCHQECYMMNS